MMDDGIMEPEYHMHSYLFNHSNSELSIQMTVVLLYLSRRARVIHL